MTECTKSNSSQTVREFACENSGIVCRHIVAVEQVEQIQIIKASISCRDTNCDSFYFYQEKKVKKNLFQAMQLDE